MSQARDGVGVPGSGGQRHTEFAGVTAPRVSHVHGRLLMSAVDQPKTVVRHCVEQRQDVVTREGEDGVHSLVAERADDDLTAGECHRA